MNNDRRNIEQFIDSELAKQLRLQSATCQVTSYQDGILTLKLLGGCSGCPSSQVAIFNSIAPILQEKFPQIKDITLA